MEGQETDGNRKRESLIRVRDKMTSSTSKRKETARFYKSGKSLLLSETEFNN